MLKLTGQKYNIEYQHTQEIIAIKTKTNKIGIQIKPSKSGKNRVGK